MLGLRLRKLREAKNLTQLEVAKALQLHRVRYGRYENDTREPDIEILSRIADFFNVTVDYLLGREVQSALPPIRLSENASALNNYALSSKTKNRYSNVAAEITEKVAALDASEQKEILQVVDAILVRKKYTPDPDGEEESS